MSTLAVRAPNWVGDVVMATPVLLAALADRRFASTAILVREHLVPILRDGPAEPALVPLRRGDEVRRLRALAPDAVLLLPNSLGAAWRAFRARVPVRAGAALSGRRPLLTHPHPVPARAGRRLPFPTAQLYRDVAARIGIDTPDLHPRLFVREDLRERVQRELAALGLAPAEPYLVVSPGAAYGAAKLWPPERFGEAALRIASPRGWRVVATGGPGEEDLVRAVAAAAGPRAVSLADAPRDLERLKALVQGARLLLVGDSGPRWYAAAFDVPCVSVMGPTDPRMTASSLEHCKIVRREDLLCSPCLRRTCPLGHHRCMREIEVGDVVLAATELCGTDA